MTQNNAVRGAEIERCVHAPDGVIQISASWLPLRDHRAAFAGRNTEYRNTGQRIYALTKEVTNEPVFMPGSWIPSGVFSADPKAKKVPVPGKKI